MPGFSDFSGRAPRIEVFQPVAEVFFDLVAYDLHRAVYQSVLFGERLVYDRQPRRQPPFGELPAEDAARTVTVYFAAEDRRRGLRPFFGRYPAAVQFAPPVNGLWLLCTMIWSM